MDGKGINEYTGGTKVAIHAATAVFLLKRVRELTRGTEAILRINPHLGSYQVLMMHEIDSGASTPIGNGITALQAKTL